LDDMESYWTQMERMKLDIHVLWVGISGSIAL